MSCFKRDQFVYLTCSSKSYSPESNTEPILSSNATCSHFKNRSGIYSSADHISNLLFSRPGYGLKFDEDYDYGYALTPPPGLEERSDFKLKPGQPSFERKLSFCSHVWN